MARLLFELSAGRQVFRQEVNEDMFTRASCSDWMSGSLLSIVPWSAQSRPSHIWIYNGTLACAILSHCNKRASNAAPIGNPKW